MPVATEMFAYAESKIDVNEYGLTFDKTLIYLQEMQLERMHQRFMRLAQYQKEYEFVAVLPRRRQPILDRIIKRIKREQRQNERINKAAKRSERAKARQEAREAARIARKENKKSKNN